jgi:predicted transcriptional regulator
MIQRVIVLVPVVDDDKKLIGVVARLDILREKLNEKFVAIGEKSGISNA